MNGFRTLAAVVVSPRKAFDALRVSPTFLFPLALLLVVNLGIQFVVYKVIADDANFDRIARDKVEWDATAAGIRLTPADAQKQIEALRQQKQYWYAVPFFGIPVVIAALAIFFYLLLRLMRAGNTFRRVLSVVCWSFVIYRGIGGLVVAASLLMRGSAHFFPVPAEAWSPTSLAHLIPRGAVPPNTYTAISKLDPFLVWWLIVLAIGLSRTSNRLTMARSATLVAGTEAVYLALNAAGLMP
jgi:hypothetical protein